ncbi:MAG: hypothetical protein KF684_05310 [Phycisphaeraceae bacterium]|nr:hypothetical protein [Phycisphaeraceae bacterium]
MSTTASGAGRSLDWRRVRKTPLRDLLRGRVTGRLDAAIIARDAGLPERLASIVGVTARRTRLFRRERADVAQEIIDHFRDGLDAGRTAQELVDSFGDPRTAARLIGRAKRRDRAVALRMMVASAKAAGLVVGLLFLVYLGLAARYHTTKPGPIVDYLAILNAPAAALPEADRAWPLYREALLGSTLRADLAKADSAMRPGWRDWDSVAGSLRANAPWLKRLREGAAKPGLGMQVHYGVSDEDAALWPDLAAAQPESTGTLGLIDILLPQLAELRRISVWFVLDTRLAREDRDADRVVANLESLLGIADHARQVPFLISEIVAVTIGRLAFGAISETIANDTALLSDADLARLAHRVSAYPGDGRPVVRLDTERAFYYDFVQHIYSLDRNGDGRLVPGWLERYDMAMNSAAYASADAAARAQDAAFGPLLSAITLSRKEALEAYDGSLDRAIAWMQTPPWEREGFDHSSIPTESLLGRARYWILEFLLPSLENALLQGEQVETKRDATTVVLALELHRRRHGEWPASLDELVPALLPRVPRDPFDGGPLKYAVRDGRPVLYSIGNDYIDDGGVAPLPSDRPAAPANPSQWRSRASVQNLLAQADSPGARAPYSWERAPGVVRGDWVFFPPTPPRQPLPEPRADPFAPEP